MIIQFFKTPSLNITGITELLHNNPQDILKIVGLTPVPQMCLTFDLHLLEGRINCT